jgi:hydroxymethylpyrimidine/phosphomethylpyrimidine kinase
VLVVGGADAVPDTHADAEFREFRSDRVPDANSHGSGCTLSAAIAAELADDAPLTEAVERAERHLDRAIQWGRDVGAGTGPVEHLAPTKAEAGTVSASDAVREAAQTFERENVSNLVPEVGMNVAVAPDCAVEPEDVVAVAGRIHRVPGGVRATGGVQPGASSHIARFLLGTRGAGAPDVTAACNVRAADEVVEVVRNRWDAVAVERADEPADAPGTMDWVASEAMTDRESAPDAVLDSGAVGKEPMVRLLAPDVESLVETVLTLDAAVE